MGVSRRQFLRCAQGALAAASFAAPLRAADPAQAGRDLSTVSRDIFTAALNSAFFIKSGAGAPAVLLLTAVRDATPASPSIASLDTFILDFYSGGGPLAQGLYRFHHDVLGTLSIFIVPSGPSTYSAVFNRLTAPLPSEYVIPVGRSRQAGPSGN